MKVLRFLPVIGIVLFVFILWNIDLHRIYHTMLALNPVFILTALLMQALVIALKAYKWNILVKPYSREFPLSRFVSSWLVGFSIGIITPGRLGDLARAYYLRARLSLGNALTTVVIDRIIDVLVLFLLSVLGILGFVGIYAVGFDYLTIILMLGGFFAVFCVLMFMVSRKETMRRLAKPIFRRFVPERHKNKARKIFHDFYTGLSRMKKTKRSVALSLLICIFSWILCLFQTYVLSLSLGLNIPFTFILCVMPVVTLLDALPVSFSGLGTRDAALIFFMGFISLSPENAVSLSILILTFNYLLIAAIGFILWLREPITLRDYRQKLRG
ncbi:MAG TPA: flippase-like domain-containing protein [Candidatus Aenigmarchaeota archaeon]|nr:flippase-like domain-containing protein [Candidatus Aenigmarchaeota archaeon]